MLLISNELLLSNWIFPVLDPAGHKTTVPVKMRQIDYNRWRCEYVSNFIGLHSVNVFFGGVPVKRSPFGVKIAPSKLFNSNPFAFAFASM